MRSFRHFTTLVVALAVASCQSPSPERSQLQLIVVLDGLRPDYVTADLMPRLHGLAETGVRFQNHHSVFPTVTRVNAASIATGSYPATHGLLGNTVYFPSFEPGEGLRTSSLANLRRIESEIDDELLHAPSLGEIFAAHGKRVLVVSSGSKGSAYLLNHTLSGGAILHSEYALPIELEEVVRERLGESPDPAEPNAARNRHAVDMLFEVGLPEIDPDLVLLWLSDPDHTAHEHGIGSEQTNESLRLVDAELGRLVDELERRSYDVNLFVTSDHGFSTHVGGGDIDDVLAPFLRTAADGQPDLVRAGHAIYDLTDDPARQADIVAALQRAPGIGAIFTAAAEPGSVRGVIPGTLSQELARWNHVRSAQILVSRNWSAAENEHGWPGTSNQGGSAGHGTTSPWDIHNTLIAIGPGLESGLNVGWPSSNVDLAPTVSHLAGVPTPATMEGRILVEALAGGAAHLLDEQQVAEPSVSVVNGDVRYTLVARITTLGPRRYLDWTRVERSER